MARYLTKQGSRLQNGPGDRGRTLGGPVRSQQNSGLGLVLGRILVSSGGKQKPSIIWEVSVHDASGWSSGPIEMVLFSLGGVSGLSCAEVHAGRAPPLKAPLRTIC